MKSIIAVIVVICSMGPSQLFASQPNRGKLGAGVLLGTPTGLSGKLWLSQRGALDATAGWDFVESDVVLQVGYLFHFPLDVPQGSLAPYVGAGGYMGYDFGAYEAEPDSLFLGARVPIGLEYNFKSLGFFVEINPVPYFYPGIGFSIGGGIGCRYYF